MDFFYNAIRGFFFQLDGVIYGLIDDVYSLLLLITRTSIFGMDEIANFSERIFALAGIFMLFKVSLSIINYVINPDDFTKEEKGFSSLFKRIVFTLVLLVITPFIFQEAYELQSIILEDNTIMHLVFGTPTQDRLPNENYVESAGKDIQFTVMYAFLQPNVAEFFATGDKSFAACSSVYQLADNGLIMRRSDSNYIYALNPECFGSYDSGADMYNCDTYFCQAFTEADAADIYQTYAQAVAQRNFSLLVRKELVLVEAEEKYVIDYKFLISTAVGVAVIYLLLLFCIDIAVRSVKLGFLEMISPIPILSYIDPKSGKDGMFKKWYQDCIKTYLSLFLRLFALYIGIYAITIIGGYTDFVTGEIIQGNWLLDVFMIIGILIFAKQLPKIIEDIFGVKLDGKFQLNPFKKIEEEALGGKRLTGLAAGTAIGLAGGRPIGGALSGFMGNKGFSDTLKTQRDKNAALRAAKLDGSTPLGRAGARFSNTLGLGGEMHQIAKEKDAIATKQKNYDTEIKNIEDRIAPVKKQIAEQKKFGDSVKSMETRAKEEIQNGNGGNIGRQYLQYKAEYERLKNDPTATAAAIANAEADMHKYLNDTGMKQYMTEAAAGSFSDGTDDKTFTNMYSTAQQAGAGIGVTLGTDGATMHGQFGAAKGQIGTLERSIYEEEQAIEATKVSKAELGEELRAIEKREVKAKANQSAIK